MALLRGEQRTLVRALRPNAVALTDSFGYPDYMLNSALGRRDGNVYQVGGAVPCPSLVQRAVPT